jgi:hypothetical protein
MHVEPACCAIAFIDLHRRPMSTINLHRLAAASKWPPSFRTGRAHAFHTISPPRRVSHGLDGDRARGSSIRRHHPRPDPGWQFLLILASASTCFLPQGLPCTTVALTALNYLDEPKLTKEPLTLEISAKSYPRPGIVRPSSTIPLKHYQLSNCPHHPNLPPKTPLLWSLSSCSSATISAESAMPARKDPRLMHSSSHVS